MIKYINEFEFLNDIISGNINFEKHFSRISKDMVIKNLEKQNKKVPLSQTFIITTEVMKEENYEKLPQSIQNEISQLSENIRKAQSKAIEKLLQLKKNYPNVPCIYNFLANGYFLSNNYQKQFEIIRETINRFPEYLFGKIALADYYRHNNKLAKIYDSFDGILEIYQISPRKDITYHKSEIFGFYHNVAAYYCNNKQIDEALLCYCLFREIDKDHPSTKELANRIGLHQIESMRNTFLKEAKKIKEEGD